MYTLCVEVNKEKIYQYHVVESSPVAEGRFHGYADAGEKIAWSPTNEGVGEFKSVVGNVDLKAWTSRGDLVIYTPYVWSRSIQFNST